MLDKLVTDFELASSDGTTFRLSKHQGKPLVLYFYPRDNTPGCTTEAMEFRDVHEQFAKLHCGLYGISRDSIKAHNGFKCKLELPFELLSDAEEIACKLFGVIKMKKMYGREVRGIERSTFLIDKNGVLRKEWRGVKVAGHVQEILDAVKSLS